MHQHILISLTREELNSIISSAVQQAITALPKSAPPEPAEEKLLSIEEVINLFKVSKATIYNWRKEGRLPYHTIGRKVVFRSSEILEALNSYPARKRRANVRY